VFFFASGCGESTKIAEAGVSRIHTQMNSEQFTDIYAQSDPEFRAASKQQDFFDFMNAVHRKLGKIKSASKTSYSVNFTTSGTRVRLDYQTKFEGGDGDEEFLWHLNGKEAQLVGYHINSMALITK
jgi:hypothetical protein